LLRNAYYNSLRLAKENNIKSVSFPSISTGAYRYPVEKAAETALSAVIEFAREENSPDEVRFVLFSDSDYQKYKSVLAKLTFSLKGAVP